MLLTRRPAGCHAGNPSRPERRPLRVRPRSRRRRRRRVPARLLAGLAATVLATAASAVPTSAVPTPPSAAPAASTPFPSPLRRAALPGEQWHEPPVDAPVVDGFRPPTTPFGAGNRGLEYDTEPGTVVRASAGGQVVFAGLVARTRHVTLAHPGGLRTSYSYLATIDVVIGQRVARGDRLGLAGERLHFGARRGGLYVDPLLLFFPHVTPDVELLPTKDYDPWRHPCCQAPRARR